MSTTHVGAIAPGIDCVDTDTVLRWITNSREAVQTQSCTTHAHALAKRQVAITQETLDRLNAVDAGSSMVISQAQQLLHQAKRCVATDALGVATQREAFLRHRFEQQAADGDGDCTWESVPLVLHECVTPGIDALQLAVEMNCDLTAKSNYTVTDAVTGQLHKSGTTNAIHLEMLRRAYGSRLNINGLDVNCGATSIDGETVHLADYMLGKLRSS